MDEVGMVNASRTKLRTNRKIKRVAKAKRNQSLRMRTLDEMICIQSMELSRSVRAGALPSGGLRPDGCGVHEVAGAVPVPREMGPPYHHPIRKTTATSEAISTV